MVSPVPWLDARSIIEGSGLLAGFIEWPNEPFAPPPAETGQLWASVMDVGEALAPIELSGNGAWQEGGRIMMAVYAPSNTGSIAARQMAKAIANLFRGLPPRPVVYEDASVGAGQVTTERGNYWGILLSIGFKYQDFPTP